MRYSKGLLNYRFDLRLRDMKIVFLCLAFLSFAIISSYEAFFSFDVPFPAIIIFLLFMIGYCACCSNVKIKFTWIPVLLLLRLLIFCINAVFVNASSDALIDQITITVCSVFVFLCAYNFISSSRKELNVVLTVFSLVTSIQIIVCVIFNTFDKTGIVAGIGLSNYAACFLLLCISYLLFVKTNKFEKLVIILDIAALFATQSFGAYLALFAVFVIFILRTFKRGSRRVRRYMFATGIVAIVGVIIFFKTSLGEGAWNKINEKLIYFLQGNWKNFGSSRGELFSFSWENIKRNLLFGTVENINPAISERNPLSRWQGFRTHNIMLESLLLYGVIGSLINVAILVYICNCCSKKIRYDSRKYSFIPCFLAIFIHGMIEPGIFTLHFEIFLWLLIGAFLTDGNKAKTSSRVTADTNITFKAAV